MQAVDAGLLASIGVNFIALYAAFRKERTAARKADTEAETERAQADAEIEDRVISRWQAFAQEQEAARQREAGRLEGQLKQVQTELESARKERGECREQSARQEERIEHLMGDVRELRAALKRHGIKSGGSGDHEPLPKG